MAPEPPPARSFPQALAAAARGLRLAAPAQRHFRAQLVIAAGALLFAAWAGTPGVELAVLAITVGVVLGAELLNTAVEMLTDLLHPDHGPAAAAVKDVAAAAVLTAAVCALAVGILVLWPRIGELPPAAARGIPAVLGALCLATLVLGAAHHHRPRRP